LITSTINWLFTCRTWRCCRYSVERVLGSTVC